MRKIILAAALMLIAVPALAQVPPGAPGSRTADKGQPPDFAALFAAQRNEAKQVESAFSDYRVDAEVKFQKMKQELVTATEAATRAIAEKAELEVKLKAAQAGAAAAHAVVDKIVEPTGEADKH